ncbi:hypothetical protein B0H13DRAFT_2316246 [Mycena leptocephala]|nr:hypothetical protein B0H13DRAFT_2316246 [Mycena leptocephala]
MAPTAKLAILGYTRTVVDIVTAFDPDTPYALVVLEDLTVDENAAIQAMQIPEVREDTPLYFCLYYRVHTPDGAIRSKTAFDSTDPFVGRITATSVPHPLHTWSLRECMVTVEKNSDPDWIFPAALFLNPTATQPMDVEISARGGRKQWGISL